MCFNLSHTINGVGSNIAPLTKFLGRLCKRHVGRNRRVNDSLRKQNRCDYNQDNLIGTNAFTFVPSTEIIRYKFRDES